MITKTEVTSAIARCERASGWGALDHTPTQISRGDLHVLIEAAKCAHYEQFGRVGSMSDLVLDYEIREPFDALGFDGDTLTEND